MHRKKPSLLFFLFSLLFSLAGCKNEKNTPGPDAAENRYVPKPYVEINHPEWSRNTTLYKVNLRQFTPEGTFKAFETHLPRLKEMGIDIIWLKPVHPIGEKNRKGMLAMQGTSL